MANATAAGELPLDMDADMDDDLQVFGGEAMATSGAEDAHTGSHRASNNDYLGSLAGKLALLRMPGEIWLNSSDSHLATYCVPLIPIVLD